VTTDFLETERRRREAAGLQRTMRAVDGPQDTHLLLDGRRVLSLCSNNYLGIANHPALADAAARAARDLGVGSGASRLISGSMRIHHDLEEQLAAFKGTERAILFTSGYHANVGTIAALVGAGDAVFSDELNHASLVDGCRISRAQVHVYRHADTGDLDEALRTSMARRKLVVTDSIFSMDGDAAPLADICQLADRHGAMVMVDEAHATGVRGAGGAGLVEELDLRERVTVQMGTLGKAFGTFGAYVGATNAVVDHLVNCARTFIFTTALPPPIVAASAAALELVRSEPWRRAQLRDNARRLRRGLRDLGYDVPGGHDSHIAPVMVGDADETMRLSEALLERGVFAHGIRPPTVPAGTSRIRATVMATHSNDDIDEATRAFRPDRSVDGGEGRG
jgi:8-amino-7-oxononanoate synthase